MACFRPLKAWQGVGSGRVYFGAEQCDSKSILLPCGRCIGCRLVRVRSWSIRCMHEAQMHEFSSFVTLTYDGDHFSPSLNYLDFQRFMYRLRCKLGATRFFMCGEYGDTTLRPHFHALLFGRAFSDRQCVGRDLYRSSSLEDLWPHGFSSVGDVTFQSAAYVAKYALKKCSGDLAERRYSRVDSRTGEVVRVVPELVICLMLSSLIVM